MRQFLYKILFILFLGLMLPQTLFAVQMSFDAQKTQAQIGEKFEVDLFVNTEQESVNAFEGKMNFSNNLLELREIRDGNSIVNFWIERPQEQNGVIIFSGITPGGFNGENGLIFSAIFEAKKEGVARFKIGDARVLRNDGAGSTASLETAPFEVVVLKGVQAKISTIPEVKDIEPPESFMPEIARDPKVFDGKWFLVFATQDKESGIDHYEIRETQQWVRLENLLPFVQYFRRHSWITAESSYVLRDQELRSYIYVRAIDKARNERMEKILPKNPLRWYENYENWIIIILVGLIAAYFIRGILWRKK